MKNAINLYHGTSAKFKTFKLNEGIANPTYGEGAYDNNLGVFLTNNITMAKWFAGLITYDVNVDRYVDTEKEGRVLKVDCFLSKPYLIHGEVAEEDDGAQIYFNKIKAAGGPENFKRSLIEKGHDGIIVTMCTTNYYAEGDYIIVVVFDSGNVKIVK